MSASVHRETQTDVDFKPIQNKSTIASLTSKLLLSGGSKNNHPEDYTNGYEFVKDIPSHKFLLAEPQITTWISGTHLITSSILICVTLEKKLEKCNLKKHLSLKGLKLQHYYIKSVNAVTKIYKIDGKYAIVVTHQTKTNFSDLIYALETLTSYLKQRKDEPFTLTLDVNYPVNKLMPVLDYITNSPYNNIKWVLNIPFNMAPQYEKVLSSRWITGEPSKFSHANCMDFPPTSPIFYKELSAESSYKNSIMEIMFYMKHSDSLIKSHLMNHYIKNIHLLPFSASSLRQLNIFVFDNVTKQYLEEPISKHQFGFDGNNLVQLCEDTNTFLTSNRYIFCSAGTEIMLDHQTYNSLNNIYINEEIKMPHITNIQGVPGCGKSTWIINNHKLGRDLVLCATKEGVVDIKLKVAARCDHEKIDFNNIKLNYKTIASYLINGKRTYETVFIDEYMLVHAGYIGLVAILSKCSKLYVLGDKNQIPYIDRLHHVNMQFSDASAFITNTEYLNVTYRCPADVAYALKEYYPNISSMNTVVTSTKFINLPPTLSSIPVLDNMFYLTFTKADKHLITQLKIPETSKVMTIHEAQGLTSPNVICIRINPQPLELFDSVPHAIVAISRHTQSFRYFSPVANDRLHSLLMKARTYTSESSNALKIQSSKKSKKTLTYEKCAIYYQNVNKMASKASQFYNFVLKSNYLIYVICETSLNPGIQSSEYFGHDYVVYRCDRSLETSSKKSGGGVLIAVHSKLWNAPVTLTPSRVEQIGVKIKINQTNLIIYAAYIPPQSNSDVYATCIDAIDEVINTTNASDLVLVLGDFNLPNISWNFDPELNCILPCNITTDAESLFVDAMLGFSLNQINTIANSRDRFLDLVFSNEIDTFKIYESVSPFVINDINHKSLDIVFDLTNLMANSEHLQQIKFNFKKTNRAGLQSYLESINWEMTLNSNDINENVDKFNDIMLQGFDLYVPMCCKPLSAHPPWFDDRLVNLKNRKSKAYAKMLKSGLEADKTTFLEHSNEFEIYFKSKYRSYLYQIQEQIKVNPKQFWKYFRNKREIEGYPANMTYNDASSSNSKDIADMFASFFQSVYRPRGTTSSYKPPSNNNISISPPVIFEDDILCALKDFGDGCGPDNIPSFMLKEYANILTTPLCYLFNHSLSTGDFPVKWKVSKITPIFKSGKRDDITCYRGISTTSSIPKLFELVLCNNFKSTITRHISVNQHGFMPGRSTSTNLVEFTSKIINEIEKHHQVDVVYTDFSKAFDSICHHRALQSLFTFGFSLDYINWFKSYLTNRQQYVMMGNERSHTINVTSGVPQGSHIGPWVFIIFIDPITEIIKNSNVLIFADDVKIYRTVNGMLDAEKLQDDMDRLSEWCDRNSLYLNIKKCKIMSFHRKKKPLITSYKVNNEVLQRVNETTDLGVIFVENASFNRHIENCIAKANTMFGFVKRWTGEFRDIQTLCSLYFAYVRSQLEYAVTVWNPYYAVHIKRIESIQKKFLIFLLKKDDWDYDQNLPFHVNVARLPPYATRCKDYKLCTLENRRILLSAAFIGNILLGHIDSSYVLEKISIYVPCRAFRNHEFLALEHHSTNYGENNPINRLSKSFNIIDDLFDFNLTKDNFKNILKNYF